MAEDGDVERRLERAAKIVLREGSLEAKLEEAVKIVEGKPGKKKKSRRPDFAVNVVGNWSDEKYVEKVLKNVDSEVYLPNNFLGGKGVINFDVVVSPKGKLVVEPGSKLVFGRKGGVLSYGSLIAEGFEDEQIVFTSKNRWKNIAIIGEDSKDSVLDYCLIEKGSGKKGISSEFSEPSENINTNNRFAGGGLILYNSDVVVSNSVFKNNSSEYGGAVFFYGSRILLNNNKFIGNKGEIYSAISNRNCDFVEVEGNTFEDNEGTSGCLSFFGGVDGYIKNNVFKNNISPLLGSCLSFLTGDSFFRSKKKRSLEINDNIFEENETYSGGVVCIKSESDFNILMEHNKFINNLNDNGGALYIFDYSGNPVIDNNTITGNKSRIGDGGGVYLINPKANTDLIKRHNKIEDNYPEDLVIKESDPIEPPKYFNPGF